MRRHELTDEEWAIIAPLLPNKGRGVARVDDRRVINGILWRSAPGRHGGMCRSAVVCAQPSTTVSFAGGRQGYGTGRWKRSRSPMTATS